MFWWMDKTISAILFTPGTLKWGLNTFIKHYGIWPPLIMCALVILCRGCNSWTINLVIFTETPKDLSQYNIILKMVQGFNFLFLFANSPVSLRVHFNWQHIQWLFLSIKIQLWQQTFASFFVPGVTHPSQLTTCGMIKWPYQQKLL